MQRMPRVTGEAAVKALEKARFEVIDRSASHVYLHRWMGFAWTERVTVPVHGGKTIKLKTLSSILKQAHLSVEKFINYL